jgi:hypothetical protein
MAKRIMDYTPDPLFPTPGLPRILQLRRMKAQTYTTPAEQRELKRLEETQQMIEFLYHRGKRLAARRRELAAITPPKT